MLAFKKFFYVIIGAFIKAFFFELFKSIENKFLKLFSDLFLKTFQKTIGKIGSYSFTNIFINYLVFKISKDMNKVLSNLIFESFLKSSIEIFTQLLLKPCLKKYKMIIKSLMTIFQYNLSLNRLTKELLFYKEELIWRANQFKKLYARKLRKKTYSRNTEKKTLKIKFPRSNLRLFGKTKRGII